MSDNKKIIVGDFEYSVSGDEVSVESYVGPAGPGSVATLPENVEIEGKAINMTSYSYKIENLSIERVIAKDSSYRFRNMPILKDLEIARNNPYSLEVENCPALNSIIIEDQINSPVEFNGDHAPVRIEYRKGIRCTDLEVSGDKIHTVFGDDVEDVGVIRGGHVTLGKSVKEVTAMKKADFGMAADTTVSEYELPTRIDFLSPTPPIVGAVAPGSMTVAELHVPAGALDAYMSHPQWGKAAYFVDADGKTVDKYAAKHKARLKKLQKEREEAEAEAAEQAKAEKVKAMGSMMHSAVGPQRLAKWNPGAVDEWSNSIEIPVNVGELTIQLSVPKDSPIDIWDKIVAELESIEAKLNA